MLFKTTHTYTVCPKTRLDKIFPKGLPVNSFIDKGRCAIGATYGEIMNKTRCTIITVPNISIIDSKHLAHPDLDVVYGKISYEQVEDLLRTPKPGQKIMTTPEGLQKIMDAAQKLRRLDEFKRSWFLLLDEAHTFISEYYREDILLPFKYFWDYFDNRSIVSATPYFFTDKRFYTLDFHQIKFDAPLGTVRLFNSTSVVGTLNYILTHLDEFPGNIHIFYNSVTEIVNAIIRAKLIDCTINCANDKDGKNMKKLGGFVKWFVEEPTVDTYKKVNFYTCKYFEGWDLFDKDATAIIVTDVHKPHTKIGVSNKCKQAVGRIREDEEKSSNLYQIIHVTNHTNNSAMKTLESFRSEYLVTAEIMIDSYNKLLKATNLLGSDTINDERLIKFADIDNDTKIATMNTNKLDQQINEAAKNEIYNHIDYIQKDWEDAYFKVEREDVDIKLETTTQLKRKSANIQLKEDYQTLKAHMLKKEDAMIFSIGKSVEQSIKDANPLAYQAYLLLDETKLTELKFNVKKVQAEVIIKENKSKALQFDQLLLNTFRISKFYTNEDIKCKLQMIYNRLDLRETDGKMKVAKASEIEEIGKFETQNSKRKNAKGESEHGKVILRASFSLRIAA